MPTIELDIKTGIEYSPTDGIDSAVKLHNFTVGTDGSLYKLPALRNLKNTETQIVTPSPTSPPNRIPSRLLDIRKFQTSSINADVQAGFNKIKRLSMFRRFVYLTFASYGTINVNYDDSRVSNTGLLPILEDFEKQVVDINLHTPTDVFSFTSLNPKILIDFNSQYKGDNPRILTPTDLRCVFPIQYRFPSQPSSNYPFNIHSRNMVSCSMDPATGPDIIAFTGDDNQQLLGQSRVKKDLARGPLLMGNRLFFYSAVDNTIYVSEANDFSTLAQDDGNRAIKIIPAEEIQAITDFNGNMITFTPTGMERWLLSSDEEVIIQRDPTFHYDHRVRFGGSFVKANRDLYYYTDDSQVYRLNSDFSVDSVFSGDLPIYTPLRNYLSKDEDLPMTYFKMLGSRFVSIGPWLYNLDSSTWSTYSYDGWKNPTNNPIENASFVWESNTSKQVVSTAYDNVMCTYSTICTPLTYLEMQDTTLFNDTTPTLIEGKHQWGEVAFFTTRMFQDERTFSLDGIEVYVRGGMLQEGSTMWLKILRGGSDGDFDIDDESTYGVPAYYQPMNNDVLGEDQGEHVGHFIWPRPNIKTDRFRLQVVTKESRGIVIQSVLANITMPEDSQEYLVNSNSPTKKQE